jgi:hypothetical protein
MNCSVPSDLRRPCSASILFAISDAFCTAVARNLFHCSLVKLPSGEQLKSLGYEVLCAYQVLEQEPLAEHQFTVAA